MRYDVAVIGGGPAGLMAAGRAGEMGAKVVLIEKNQRFGLKLLMTGGTRCNLTNYLEDPRELANHFGSASRFFISAFSRFGPKETVEFFKSLGVETDIETGHRVFPKSHRAQTVLEALLGYARSSGVELKSGVPVSGFVSDGNRIEAIKLADGGKIEADSYIIATGGCSYPVTGSTGDAYSWLEKLGHKVIAPRPALVPVILEGGMAASLEGLSLDDKELGIWQNKKKLASARGDMLFTAVGASGPAILNLSRFIGRPVAKGTELSIDLFPDTDIEELDAELRGAFTGNNRSVKNILSAMIPARLADAIGAAARLDAEKQGNAVTREERRRLAATMKDFRFGIRGLEGFDKAMVTSGGADLKEVDPKTMRSKMVSNLFLAGEILDAAGPTGGFNLQACWSTGRIAGEAAAS